MFPLRVSQPGVTLVLTNTAFSASISPTCEEPVRSEPLRAGSALR